MLAALEIALRLALDLRPDFTAARAALDRTHDPAGQREILLSLGEAALSEHAEWTLMHRERHVEHSKL